MDENEQTNTPDSGLGCGERQIASGAQALLRSCGRPRMELLVECGGRSMGENSTGILYNEDNDAYFTFRDEV